MHNFELFRLDRWNALKARIAEGPPEASYGQIHDLGEGLPIIASMDGLVGGPDDVWGLTIAGGITLQRAKRLRGRARASELSEAKVAGYGQELMLAVELLEQAVKVDRSNGVAAAFLVGAYIEFDASEKFDAVTTMLQAQGIPASGYLNNLLVHTEKWGGTQDGMWNVVRLHKDRAVPGTLALIAAGHFEQAMWEGVINVPRPSSRRINAYFRRADVREELKQASNRAWEGSQNSDPYTQRLIDGHFATVLVHAGLRRLARRHFERLGDYQDPQLWFHAPIGQSGSYVWDWYRHRAGLWGKPTPNSTTPPGGFRKHPGALSPRELLLLRVGTLLMLGLTAYIFWLGFQEFKRM